MDQNRTPLADELKKYKDSGRLSMHIPGHKGRSGSSKYDVLSEVIDNSTLSYDITEIAGFDDFHEPEGIILEAQQLAAETFGAEETYFLTNGTTSGIMAAIAACAGEGDLVLAARDCHKSVTRGLILSGAQPVYIKPHIDGETLLSAGISALDVKSAFEKNPDIKALVLTHPSYYGTYSDLGEIAEIAHSYGAVVIADEAHGGHLAFAGQEDIPSAMNAGADIAIQSTHKMPGSLTQSSMLHIQGSLVDREKLRYFISFMTSTSPSYLLMASLDAVRHRMAMEGQQLWQNVVKFTTAAADAIDKIPGIKVVKEFSDGNGVRKSLERCRLLISAIECGLSGSQLADMLFEEYLIDVEFSDDIYCLAVMGANSQEHDLAALKGALRYISNHYFSAEGNVEAQVSDSADTGDDRFSCCVNSQNNKSRVLSLESKCVVSPRKAVSAPKTLKTIYNCAGMISAREIAVYPPGIPCIQPGEVFTKEIVTFIIDEIEKGTHIHGLSHRKDGDADVWEAAVLLEK